MQITSSIELPEKEASFVSGLVLGLAPTSAAKSAGFAISHTAALLKRDRVRMALASIAQNASEALRVSRLQL